MAYGGSERGLRAVVLPRPSPVEAEGEIRARLGGGQQADGYLPALRKQLQRYFAGERVDFDVPLAVQGTPFQQAVWRACRDIPYGQVRTYGYLAAAVGQPRAARAVGQALGRNPVPLIVPCHRVIGAHGRLTGFGAGLAWKEELLRLEGSWES
ncbi:MAG TPA: methylated-DNA--[protein]-cysteine S-methyltransferase [Armatimonadetes bacterium]|nr:methylated-DNA--[protein]-cysteine S-methyltransferase [Armatimonadota bacterium]